MVYSDKNKQKEYMRLKMRERREKKRDDKLVINPEPTDELIAEPTIQLIITEIPEPVNYYAFMRWKTNLNKVLLQLEVKSILPKHIYNWKFVLKDMLENVFNEAVISYPKTELIER